MADEDERKGSKRKRSESCNAKTSREPRRGGSKKGSLKAKKPRISQPHLPKSTSEMSSNWKLLHAMLDKERKTKESQEGAKTKRAKRFKTKLKKNYRTFEKAKKSNEVKEDISRPNEIWFDDVDPDDIEESSGTTVTPTGQDPDEILVTGSLEGLTKKIALDCEMVGVGFDGRRHMLARVSIVNSHGRVVYDKFTAPQEKVVDYRTPISGITPANLKNAPDFKTVQNEVSNILKGRILVGHALKNDLEVLLLDHPHKSIRDTAKYKPFQEIAKTKMPSLRALAKKLLNINIQEGEHSSVQDSQVAMKLYSLHKNQWEKQLNEAKFKHKWKESRNKLGGQNNQGVGCDTKGFS